MNERSNPPRPPGERALSLFLAQLASGEGTDVEALCAQHPELAPELRGLRSEWEGALRSVAGRHAPRRIGGEADPGIALEPEPAAAAPSPWSGLLDRLHEGGPHEHHYRFVGEVARGGMGAILRVWDEDLRRSLAMKVVLGRDDAPGSGRTPDIDPKSLGRFLEEAQITGQLDHPGVVPVHELGVDVDGRVYFTMRLVRGRELGDVFRHAREGREGWSLPRALEVLLRVCDTMAYAHDKGVVHRDLKPANVMVGRFGEVYVMDWGLAKVRGAKDSHDLRLRPFPAASTIEVHTERSDARVETPDSPLVTMDGSVVGTPAFMSLEQARGEIELVDERSDVFSAGAMLYQLLSGRMPYEEPGARLSPHTILARVLDGPPRPVHELAPQVPAELEAICDRAMARDRAARYSSMGALAADVRAFLEGRVVRAYETGAVAELRKWVRRNRGVAAASAAAVVLALAGLALAAVLQTLRRRDAVLGGDGHLFASMLREAEALWPATPQRAADMDLWLAGARELLERLPAHEERLAAMEGEEHSSGAGAPPPRVAQAALVEGLRALASADPAKSVLADVERRLALARDLSGRSIDAHRDAWDAAIAEIADEAVCPAYAGLELAPQLGLVPLGRDPASGLHEFAHVLSGEIPARGADGALAIDASSGVVLVLIPGGTFAMGAWKPSETHPIGTAGVDPMARDGEAPVCDVTLAPYFLSKHELTQAQWERATRANPSLYRRGSLQNVYDARRASGLADTDDAWIPLHPVEAVSWDDCTRTLARLDLELPTEAQWERAARAGTTSAWSTGDDPASLEGSANLVDRSLSTWASQYHVLWREVGDWGDVHDGWPVHAPVTALRANSFGLHGVHGNVFEWCLDHRVGYEVEPASGTGERAGDETDRYRALRGGSFRYGPDRARSAYRHWDLPTKVEYWIGVRPARRVDPRG